MIFFNDPHFKVQSLSIFEKVQRDKKGDQYIIENAKVYEGIDIKIDFTNDDNTSAEQTKTAKYTLKGSKPHYMYY